eukprot:TRINITY_DN6170_c3_g2_i1.p1 TRINITY_DN6170_c3_g2~~TRINITY_DN6170_c3_g2_i1.p1  ORF type:complete len:705 (+),score=160.79 TRINITY_DN6170_c3_g2_i1:94-2115(+)
MAPRRRSFSSVAYWALRFAVLTMVLAFIFHAGGVKLEYFPGDVMRPAFAALRRDPGAASTAALQRRADAMTEVQALLAQVGHSEYADSMAQAGLDSIAAIAEADGRDRREAGVSPVHWHRLVAAARLRLELPPDPTVGTETRAAAPAAGEPMSVKSAAPAVALAPTLTAPVQQPASRAPPQTLASAPAGPKPAPRAAAVPPSDVPSPENAELAGGDEKYLLLSSLTAGFASAVRTQLLPFFALAAASERTAVLPSASFGIPAFRSTLGDEKAGFVPLSTFIDMEHLRSHWPCLRAIALDEWERRASRTVDSVVFLGLSTEIGTKNQSGTGVANSTFPDLEHCYAKEMAAMAEPPPKREQPFWHGPWDFWGETVHVIQEERMKVRKVQCASLHACINGTEMFSAQSGPLSADRSVMIANFPGLVRDSFYWHSPFARKELYLFKDVPKKDICGPDTWPSFQQFPLPARPFRQVAQSVASERFGDGKFICVHIRGEKMVLRMHAQQSIPLRQLLTQHTDTLQQCVDSIATIINAAMRAESIAAGRLFLISDLDPETGSPSSARDKFFRNWTTWAGQRLQKMTGGGKGFCGTAAADKAMREGPPSVRHALSIYPGNCAMGEAALCQSAQLVLRFGQGSMGRFVSANVNRTAHYESCEEAVAVAANVTAGITDALRLK